MQNGKKNKKIFCNYEEVRRFEYEDIRRYKSKHMKPTDSEMEILQILWMQGPSSVRSVFETLNKKDIGYTTILKHLQIMHEKELVIRDTSAKTHVYQANINQEKTQHQFLDKLIETVYNGSTSRLVMQALGNHQASQEEIDEIKAYLKQLEG